MTNDDNRTIYMFTAIVVVVVAAIGSTRMIGV